MLPLSLLFMGVGADAALGHWSLMAARTLSIAGSFCGSITFYLAGSALTPQRRSFVFQMLRQPEERVNRFEILLRSNATALAFGLQLVPTARRAAPLLSGSLRLPISRFMMATVIGVAIWNTVLIMAGHHAARFAVAAKSTNTYPCEAGALPATPASEQFRALENEVRCASLFLSKRKWRQV
jgi:membrane protein DedA with SNARE-associated domain